MTHKGFYADGQKREDSETDALMMIDRWDEASCRQTPECLDDSEGSGRKEDRTTLNTVQSHRDLYLL